MSPESTINTMIAPFTAHQKLILMLLIAVLIRLAAMPFFMHMDLLSEYRRINYAFDNWSFYPGFNRLTIFYIESLFYMFTKWFVVDPQLLLNLPDPAHSVASVTTHFIFTGDPHVFRHLFIFKLPYLVFDLLAALLIWRYFDGHRLQTVALALWLFNPVTLYASYFFGRFEVISLFFLIWTALCLKQNKLLLAAVVFGLALNCREINLVLVPVFALLLFNCWKQRTASLSVLATSAAVVVFFLCLPYLIEILFNVEPLFTRETGVLSVSKGVSAFFDSQIGSIYPYFVISIVCFFALTITNFDDPSELYLVGGLSMLLPLFMIGFTSAHYFSWAVPFLILAACHRQNLLLPILVLLLAWVFFWLFNPVGAHFTPLLATPIHEAFFGYNNFQGYYHSIFPDQQIFTPALLRDLFFSICVASMITVL
ncbi:MAG: hypothetical protein KJP04_02925, partial [Arenicella sp.]|nr:hypothetical protein [Arenicella sp.]